MPSPVAGEQTPYTIRYRIEEELRNFEHSLGHALYVIGKHAEPLTLPQPGHGEIATERDLLYVGASGTRFLPRTQADSLRYDSWCDQGDGLWRILPLSILRMTALMCMVFAADFISLTSLRDKIE